MQNMRRQFQSNLFGTMAFTQPFIAHFRTRRAGHIINISSPGSIIPTPAWGVYCATKAALDLFTETLAIELKLFGVHVSLVTPGIFQTKIFSGHPSYAQEGEKPHSALSTVYTDPVTQGYNSIHNIVHQAEAHGLFVDVETLAVRIYEVGAGVGLVQKLVEEQSKPDWIRIPLGSHCGEEVLRRYKDKVENLEAYEAIWRSADLKPQR